jgi:hypothetical protein
MTNTKIKILFYIAAATIVIPGILHLQMGLNQLLRSPNAAGPPGTQQSGSFRSNSNGNAATVTSSAGSQPTQSSSASIAQRTSAAGGQVGGEGIFGLIGIFFTVAGIAQIFWGLPMARRWGMPWYYIGIGGTAVLIAIWAITRIQGNPITGRALPSSAGVYDEVFQVAYIAITVAIIIIYEKGMKRLDKKTAEKTR